MGKWTHFISRNIMYHTYKDINYIKICVLCGEKNTNIPGEITTT